MSEDRPWAIRINRTADTRIFSIQLGLSTKFSIDLGGFIDVRFWPMLLLCMF